MNPEPRVFKDGSDDIVFDVDNGGHPLRIFVGLNTIEDFLRLPKTTVEERLVFVARNRRIIEHNAVQHLRSSAAEDADSILINADLLEGCAKT